MDKPRPRNSTNNPPSN